MIYAFGHYDETGEYSGGFYPMELFGKQIPVYNTEPIETENQEGETTIAEPGTVVIGQEWELSAIPKPRIGLTEEEWREALTGNYKVVDGKHTYAPPSGPTIDQRKEAKKQQINTERNTREQSVFLFDGNTYDADKDSIQRISVAAQNALAAKITGTPFEIEWTLADNSDVTLDANGMLGVSQALAIHAATVHGIARELKAAVDAATTPEELDAITWPEG